MKVTFTEAASWRWWSWRFFVETYDETFDEYVRYDDCTWLETVILVRYFRKRGASVREG